MTCVEHFFLFATLEMCFQRANEGPNHGKRNQKDDWGRPYRLDPRVVLPW